MLRHRTLRLVFGWERPWRNIAPPVYRGPDRRAARNCLPLAAPRRGGTDCVVGLFSSPSSVCNGSSTFGAEKADLMKRIFLTGASSGIGLAIARALSANGDEIWGTARKVERIPTLPGLHRIALDLLDRNSLGEIFRSAWREAGHFDVVINNAGSGYFGPAESLSPEELARHFQVLVFGQIELLHLALEAMRERGAAGLSSTSAHSRRVCRCHTWRLTMRRKPRSPPTPCRCNWS